MFVSTLRKVGESRSVFLFYVVDFKVNCNGEFQVIFNVCRLGCVPALLSAFPLCFVVAAVLEGVHFSFGSRPHPCFVPSSDSSAVCIANTVVLWVLHK